VNPDPPAPMDGGGKDRALLSQDHMTKAFPMPDLRKVRSPVVSTMNPRFAVMTVVSCEGSIQVLTLTIRRAPQGFERERDAPHRTQKANGGSCFQGVWRGRSWAWLQSRGASRTGRATGMARERRAVTSLRQNSNSSNSTASGRVPMLTPIRGSFAQTVTQCRPSIRPTA
jgi:hypothetical protein